MEVKAKVKREEEKVVGAGGGANHSTAEFWLV